MRFLRDMWPELAVLLALIAMIGALILAFNLSR
jgi:hypothetical protein